MLIRQILENKKSVAEGSVDKKPYPKTWHDVDPKIGKLVDKMSPEEKVKKGYSNPSILKKKKEQGVAEGQGSIVDKCASLSPSIQNYIRKACLHFRFQNKKISKELVLEDIDNAIKNIAI